MKLKILATLGIFFAGITLYPCFRGFLLDWYGPTHEIFAIWDAIRIWPLLIAAAIFWIWKK